MNTAYRYLDNMEDAKDAVQNTFMRIFINLSTYDSKRSNIHTWANTYCIKECLYLIRLKKRLQLTELSYESIVNTIDHFPYEDLRLEELNKRVHALNKEEKLIIQLFYYDELSHREIADILDLKESSSRSKLSRATNKLMLNWKSLLLF